MEVAGCDADYVATGKSFFTLETSLRHLGEVFAGEEVRVETVCLAAQGRKLHLYQGLFGADGELKATGEHLLVHVDLGTRKSCEPTGAARKRLLEIGASHAAMVRPSWVEPKLGFRAAA